MAKNVEICCKIIKLGHSIVFDNKSRNIVNAPQPPDTAQTIAVKISATGRLSMAASTEIFEAALVKIFGTTLVAISSADIRGRGLSMGPNSGVGIRGAAGYPMKLPECGGRSGGTFCVGITETAGNPMTLTKS